MGAPLVAADRAAGAVPGEVHRHARQGWVRGDRIDRRGGDGAAVEGAPELVAGEPEGKGPDIDDLVAVAVDVGPAGKRDAEAVTDVGVRCGERKGAKEDDPFRRAQAAGAREDSLHGALVGRRGVQGVALHREADDVAAQRGTAGLAVLDLSNVAGRADQAARVRQPRALGATGLGVGDLEVHRRPRSVRRGRSHRADDGAGADRLARPRAPRGARTVDHRGAFIPGPAPRAVLVLRAAIEAGEVRRADGDVEVRAPVVEVEESPRHQAADGAVVEARHGLRTACRQADVADSRPALPGVGIEVPDDHRLSPLRRLGIGLVTERRDEKREGHRRALAPARGDRVGEGVQRVESRPGARVQPGRQGVGAFEPEDDVAVAGEQPVVLRGA